MPRAPERRSHGSRPAGKLRLRSSHTARVKLRVSHRAQAWQPQSKDDMLFERDLEPRRSGKRR